jgi:non-ribosomal peptide synthetase component F
MRGAKRHPELPAVCAHDGDWTYRELDELSTRVAHALIRQNLQPNQVVIIYMEKPKWVPVAQLAVMKAGCASTILDASLPLQRQIVIADLVGACYVLTSPVYAQSAAELSTERGTIMVDTESTQYWPLSPRSALPVVSPTQRCYLVFTSGSTGTLKGVIITHQNYTSAIMTQSPKLGFQKFDRVFDFTSYAFDVSRSITCSE